MVLNLKGLYLLRKFAKSSDVIRFSPATGCWPDIIIFIDVTREQLVGVNCPPPVVAWQLPSHVTVPTFLLKLADIYHMQASCATMCVSNNRQQWRDYVLVSQLYNGTG